MKYGIFVLVFAAFVAGYFVGQARPFADGGTSLPSPFTGSTSSSLTPTLNAQSAADSDTKSGSPNNQTSDLLTSNKQTSDNLSDGYQQQSILPDNSDETESRDVLASQNDDIQKNVPSSDATTSNQQGAASFPAAQEELDEWVKARKEALQQQLTDAIGEKDASWMYDQVLKDNEFLNQPAAVNAFDDDVVSRFEMEQKLRDAITARSKDPQLQILSVNCIQGRCEITLEGKDQTAAIFLFFDIQKDNTLGVIELMPPTFYMHNEGNYWLYRTLTYAVN